jgi:limonene-1,2-epoxide hydrolase
VHVTDSSAVVKEFCDLMVKRDAELLRSYFAPDAVYQNTGSPASVGVDAIIENLAGQFAMFPDSYEYEVKNLVADGDLVLTERLDYIRGPQGVRGVPVMGTFRLRQGKITRWTDYFDTGLAGKIMTGESVDDLVPATY